MCIQNMPHIENKRTIQTQKTNLKRRIRLHGVVLSVYPFRLAISFLVSSIGVSFVVSFLVARPVHRKPSQVIKRLKAQSNHILFACTSRSRCKCIALPKRFSSKRIEFCPFKVRHVGWDDGFFKLLYVCTDFLRIHGHFRACLWGILWW